MYLSGIVFWFFTAGDPSTGNPGGYTCEARTLITGLHHQPHMFVISKISSLDDPSEVEKSWQCLLLGIVIQWVYWIVIQCLPSDMLAFGR
jgi:hypothetical protein